MRHDGGLGKNSNCEVREIISFWKYFQKKSPEKLSVYWMLAVRAMEAPAWTT